MSRDLPSLLLLPLSPGTELTDAYFTCFGDAVGWAQRFISESRVCRSRERTTSRAALSERTHRGTEQPYPLGSVSTTPFSNNILIASSGKWDCTRIRSLTLSPILLHPPSDFLTAPCYLICLGMRNGQPLFRKESIIMVLVGCAGFAANFFSAKVFVNRSDITSTIGSFVVGILGGMYAKFTKGSAFVVMVVGILFQLPSGLANGGLLQFANESTTGNSNSYSSGFSVATQLISVAIGLTYVSPRFLHFSCKRADLSLCFCSLQRRSFRLCRGRQHGRRWAASGSQPVLFLNPLHFSLPSSPSVFTTCTYPHIPSYTTSRFVLSLRNFLHPLAPPLDPPIDLLCFPPAPCLYI